ncbi:MAG: fatty acid desaturase [Bacteroidia bacterium]
MNAADFKGNQPEFRALTNARIRQGWGIGFALLIMTAWTGLLVWGCQRSWVWQDPLLWALIAVQTYAFTGLFITAHDAMHGTVSHRPWVNRWVGFLCLGAFAFNSWNRMLPEHHRHHRFVGTDEDPDFGPPRFFPWFWKFIRHYVHWTQILACAIVFNIFKYIGVDPASMVQFYIIPSVLALFQLFYFGTYRPHFSDEESGSVPNNEHRSRSLATNHVWAMLTCYFFGYHWEHHEAPGIPWWQLYRTK